LSVKRPGRRTKRLLVVAAVLAVLLVGGRLALNPLVAWRTRVALSHLEGMRGRFDEVSVNVHDLSYEITNLSIEKVSAGGAAVPYFSVRSAKFGLYFKELVRGHLVAAGDLERPRLNMISAKKQKDNQEVAEAKPVGKGISKLAPFRLDRLQVKGGEIHWVDASNEEKPALRLHGIEGTLENFATRKALAESQPTVLAARGTLQESGRVSVFATADPLAKKVTFAGQGELKGLRLAELATLIGAKSGIEPDKGIFDLNVRFEAKEGKITGGVRPILKGVDMKAHKGGIGPKLKALLADAGIKIFSDDVAGRQAVATTIPIRGTIDDPDVQAVPTILGILRNAFVRGLSDGLSGLPQPTAKKGENVLEQARNALSPKRGAQPKAQPSGK
jgi:Domain of Unknown Function (DUF748)